MMGPIWIHKLVNKVCIGLPNTPTSDGATIVDLQLSFPFQSPYFPFALQLFAKLLECCVYG